MLKKILLCASCCLQAFAGDLSGEQRGDGMVPKKLSIGFSAQEEGSVKIGKKFDTSDCSFLKLQESFSGWSLSELLRYRSEWFPWLKENQLTDPMNWETFVHVYVIQSTRDQVGYMNFYSSEPYSRFGATMGGLAVVYDSWTNWKSAYSAALIQELQKENLNLKNEKLELTTRLNQLGIVFQVAGNQVREIFNPRKCSSGGSTNGSTGSPLNTESDEEVSQPTSLLIKKESRTPEKPHESAKTRPMSGHSYSETD